MLTFVLKLMNFVLKLMNLQPPQYGHGLQMERRIGHTQANTRIGMNAKGFVPQVSARNTAAFASTQRPMLSSRRVGGGTYGNQTARGRGPPLMLPPSAVKSGSQSAR